MRSFGTVSAANLAHGQRVVFYIFMYIMCGVVYNSTVTKVDKLCELYTGSPRVFGSCLAK